MLSVLWFIVEKHSPKYYNIDDDNAINTWRGVIFKESIYLFIHVCWLNYGHPYTNALLNIILSPLNTKHAQLNFFLRKKMDVRWYQISTAENKPNNININNKSIPFSIYCHFFFSMIFDFSIYLGDIHSIWFGLLERSFAYIDIFHIWWWWL